MWPFNWEYIKGTAVSKCPFAMPSVDMNGPWPTPKTELVNVSLLGFGSVIWLNYPNLLVIKHGRLQKSPKLKAFSWEHHGTSWNKNGRFSIAMAMISANQTVQTIACHCTQIAGENPMSYCFLLAKSPSYSCNIPIKSPLFLVYHHVWLKNLSFNIFSLVNTSFGWLTRH